ncbi:MAG: carbohydrate ABC transporter permease [Nitrososphaeria archaeon]
MRLLHIIEKIIVKGITVLIILISSFPIIWTFITSLKPEIIAINIPPVLFFTPTLENYAYLLFNPMLLNFSKYLINSVIVTIFSTALTISLSTLAAYGCSRFRFPGAKLYLFTILFFRLLPPVAAIVPLYIMMRSLNLLDTHFALIITYTAFNIPFAVWMMRGFFMEVPIEIEEAAMVDGCSRFSAFYRVALPLALPGLVATSIYSFLLSWNDFLLAFFLTSMKAPTLPILAQLFKGETAGIKWGLTTAAATLTILPPIIFAFLIQRYLIKGLTFGAIKG